MALFDIDCPVARITKFDLEIKENFIVTIDLFQCIISCIISIDKNKKKYEKK
jgi:hypothetical protein